MKRTASTIALTAMLTMAAPALASAAGYIKFDGVDGEAATEVALDGWSFGACQSGTCNKIVSPRDPATGQASGKRTYKPAKLTASHNSQSLRSGINVTAGDVDGDGQADLAYAGTVAEVSSFTLHFDKASPLILKVCGGKHIAKAELGRGAETMVIEHAAVTCSSGAATRTTQGATFGEKVNTGLQAGAAVSMTITGGQMKHTKTGHVTILK